MKESESINLRRENIGLNPYCIGTVIENPGWLHGTMTTELGLNPYCIGTVIERNGKLIFKTKNMES